MPAIFPGNLLVTGSSGGEEIPAIGVTQQSAAALATSDGSYPRIHLELGTRFTQAIARNVIADLPGRTEETVVLCAHYDGHHLAESAIDNGSGVAVALTIAEALAPILPSLRRGLRVAFFTIEEWGLLGSRAYVDQLNERERRRISLVINLDSVAGGSCLTALTSGFEDLNRFVAEASKEAGTPVGVHLPIMANSDHYNFARHGIPALRLVSGFGEPDSRLRYLLTPEETLEKITPEELSTAARTAAAMVYQACASEEPAAEHKSFT